MARELVGLVPAAGYYRRGDFPIPKECMPVDEDRILADYLVDSMVDAGVDKIVFVIADDRQPLIKHYSQPGRLLVPHVFVVDKLRRGIPYSILWAYPWIKDANVLFGMPDTLFRPFRAMSYLTGSIYWNENIFHHDPDFRADVLLGLFPTDNPYRFGMVKIAPDDRVVWCKDKPVRKTRYELAGTQLWGIALWQPAFTRWIYKKLRSDFHFLGRPSKEAVLTDFFDPSMSFNFRVKGYNFMQYGDAGYFDVADQYEFERARMMIEEGIF